MRRNCIDAYGYLHRKWAYFASQSAMRYHFFPSLIISNIFPFWLNCCIFCSSISAERLKSTERSKYDKAVAHYEKIGQTVPEVFYFNKGLWRFVGLFPQQETTVTFKVFHSWWLKMFNISHCWCHKTFNIYIFLIIFCKIRRPIPTAGNDGHVQSVSQLVA